MARLFSLFGLATFFLALFEAAHGQSGIGCSSLPQSFCCTKRMRKKCPDRCGSHAMGSCRRMRPSVKGAHEMLQLLHKAENLAVSREPSESFKSSAPAHAPNIPSNVRYASSDDRRGTGGLVNVRSPGGPVRIRPPGGPVRVRPAGGPVRVRPTGGPVRVRPVGGPVRVRPAGGPVRVRPAGKYSQNNRFSKLIRINPQSKNSIHEGPRNCGQSPSWYPCMDRVSTNDIFLQCCQDFNIPAECHPLCQYGPRNDQRENTGYKIWIQAISRNRCSLKHVSLISYCASQNRNNVGCCQDLGMANIGVNEECLRFCDPRGYGGIGIFKKSDLHCIANWNVISYCHESGLEF